jgi:acyl carrier protein
MTADSLTLWLRVKVAHLIEIPLEEVAQDTPLMDLGLDSIVTVQLCGLLSEKIGREVFPTIVFDHSTVASLAAYLVELDHLTH